MITPEARAAAAAYAKHPQPERNRLMCNRTAVALLLAVPALALGTPAAAQDAGLGQWWRQSFGYQMPATVQPEPYSVELAERGIGCQTASRPPEWALAEAIGRGIIARYKERGFPGQSIGTWQDDLDSAHNNGPMRYLACQIANRGTAADTAFYLIHGARSFPDDAMRLVKELPGGQAVDAAEVRAKALADARAAVAGVR